MYLGCFNEPFREAAIPVKTPPAPRYPDNAVVVVEEKVARIAIKELSPTSDQTFALVRSLLLIFILVC
jgi:hypothetical protein